MNAAALLAAAALFLSAGILPLGKSAGVCRADSSPPPAASATADASNLPSAPAPEPRIGGSTGDVPSDQPPRGDWEIVVSEAELAALIQDLGADEWSAREKATERLRAAGDQAEAALLGALRSQDAEVRSRAAALLKPLVLKKIEGLGFIGIYFNADPAAGGMRVIGVIEGTPAEREGLKEGDLIAGLDGDSTAALAKRGWEGTRDFLKKVQTKAPGTKIALEIRRDGKTLEAKFALAALPENLKSYKDFSEMEEKRWEEWLENAMKGPID